MTNETLTCIIVDDQPFAIENLKGQILACPNVKILATFNDPEDALEYLLKSPRIDILFSDVDMPGLSGLELAEKTREKYQHLVLVTSHIIGTLNTQRLGVYHHLHKPFSQEHFQEIMQAIESTR